MVKLSIKNSTDNNNIFIISVEGIDGSGKSSIVKHITYVISLFDFSSMDYNFPSSGKYGVEARNNLNLLKPKSNKALANLFVKDFNSFDYKNKNVDILVFDRYIDSFYAYQSNLLNKDTFCRFNRLIKAKKPDITIFIDTDEKVAMNRVISSKKNTDNLEKKDIKFFKRVNNCFRSIFENRTNIITVNGNNSLKDIKKLLTIKLIKLIIKLF